MRLIVAEDSALFREGLVRLLTDAGFEVVATAEEPLDLIRKVMAHRPDAAVVDIRMPPDHDDEGIRAAEELGRRAPEVGVLVLSQYSEASWAVRLLRDGTRGRGYLLKERVRDVEELASALRRVAAGGSVVDRAVVAPLLNGSGQRSRLDDLSPREREILGLMAEGRSNRAITDRLVLSERTVESHVASIFRKLDLSLAVDDHRRVMAVLAYLRSG